MADKKNTRLSRSELLELLIEESEKSERLEKQLKEAQEKLASRDLTIANSGSIAEAALALSGVFEAAQDACAQYTENIRRLSMEQEKVNAAREAESWKKAVQMINDAAQRARQIEADVRTRCEKMVELAGAEVDQFRKRIMEIDVHETREGS